MDSDATHLTPAQVDKLLEGCGTALGELQVVGIELRNWAESNHASSGLTRDELVAM